jgi:hypothetical protein
MCPEVLKLSSEVSKCKPLVLGDRQGRQRCVRGGAQRCGGDGKGVAVQVDSIKNRVEKRVKLNCDVPLSNVAFNLKFRRCTKAKAEHGDGVVLYQEEDVLVGWCRLTL